jgi:hypothetical protein
MIFIRLAGFAAFTSGQQCSNCGRKSGEVVAIAYSWIERVEFNPTEGITLHVHGDKIRIKGRNLNAEARPEIRLFQGIARHRVAWVQEADRPGTMNSSETTAIVEKIDW